MEASLKRENTRIRDRLAALRCRSGEDAVLFGSAPGALLLPESAGPPTKVKYQPPSQLLSTSTGSASTHALGLQQHGSSTSADKAEAKTGKAAPIANDDLMGVIQNLIRTILEDKDEVVSKANCYRALHRYASAQLEIRQVRVQILRLQREGTVNPDKSEQQVAKLGAFLKDLQVIHTEQQRTFREAMEAKDAQLYYQEERLRASASQVQELKAQLQVLRQRSAEYENDIRRLNAALAGDGDQQRTAAGTAESQPPPVSFSGGESQEAKDLKIKELQAQLDALMSVKAADSELDDEIENSLASVAPTHEQQHTSLSEASMGDQEIESSQSSVAPTNDRQHTSLSEASMGDYCDFLDPTPMPAEETKNSRSAPRRSSPIPKNETTSKTSVQERDIQTKKANPDGPGSLETADPRSTSPQGSSQSLDVLAAVGPPKSATPSGADSKATSQPVAIRSILRKPKHSPPPPPPPAVVHPQTALADSTDTDATQDVQVGSSNVSLDLSLALDKGGTSGPRSSSPIIKSKKPGQGGSERPPMSPHPTTAGGSSDASLDFLAVVATSSASSTASSTPTVQRGPSSAVAAPRIVAPVAAARNSEGSLQDFIFGGSDECAVPPVITQSVVPTVQSDKYPKESNHGIESRQANVASSNQTIVPLTDPNEAHRDPSCTTTGPDLQGGNVESEGSLQDDLFGRSNDDTIGTGEEEKKESDESSSVSTPVPDNQKGFDESEASLQDELFPIPDDSSEGGTTHADDVASSARPTPNEPTDIHKTDGSPQEQVLVAQHEGIEGNADKNCPRLPQGEPVDTNPEECLSVATPIPDNQKGFDTSEASLQDDLFFCQEDVDGSDGSLGVKEEAKPSDVADADKRDGLTTSRQGGDLAIQEVDCDPDDEDERPDEVLSVVSPVPDNQKGFDASEASLEDELFPVLGDDESEAGSVDDENSGAKQSETGASGASPTPNNQKGFDASESSLQEQTFASDEDGIDQHEIDPGRKNKRAADHDHANSHQMRSDAVHSTSQSGIDERCIGDTRHNIDEHGIGDDELSTRTPEPDNQKGYDESEGSLDNLFDEEDDAELDVIEEDDEASSIATEPGHQDGSLSAKGTEGGKLAIVVDQPDDEVASSATPAPDNQRGYESEGSLIDELFVGESDEVDESPETALKSEQIKTEGGSLSDEANKGKTATTQSPLTTGIVLVPADDSQHPDLRDLTVDESSAHEGDEGQDESSTIDSVTGVSYLQGSEDLTEQLVSEACPMERCKSGGVDRVASMDPEPSSAQKEENGVVSSPASRAERVVCHELKRQDTVSSTFGVDSLRFLSAGSLQWDESQRSTTRRSSRHSKQVDEARLNRSSSTSRSRPPLFSVPPIQEEEKPSTNDHPSDLVTALELSASRGRSIELSRKVEQLTLQLEQERAAYASEYQSIQRELQDTKNALEKCKGTVSALEKEIAETEYNLVQAKQKVSMLETYVVEDLVPPEDVIGECYASKGLEFRRPTPNESGSDSDNEMELLRKEAADLRGQLTVANTLVIKLEDDRSRQLKKISDLTELLQANKDSKKRLFEKSVECADLASERDLIKMQLDNLREKNNTLEMKLSETLDEIEDLRISSASKSVRDFAIPAEHLEERERTLNRVMETSIELAECKMKLDRVTEQLKAEQKKNLELAASVADLDRSSSMGGLRTRVNMMSLNLSNHSPSQAGGRNLLGMSTGMLSNSYHGATTNQNETADVRRLQRRVAELEQQNEAYRLQVASLKQQSRMGTVRE